MKWFVLFLLAAPAEAQNKVALQVTYFGAPTEWCAQDEGVPFVANLDGPDVLAEQPPRRTSKQKTVTVVRRLGDEIIEMEVPVSGAENPETEPDVVGRLSAEFRGCHTLRRTLLPVNGTWAVKGLMPESGPINDLSFYSIRLHEGKIFGVSFYKIGDRKFYAPGPFERTTTETFAFQGEKEQQK